MLVRFGLLIALCNDCIGYVSDTVYELILMSYCLYCYQSLNQNEQEFHNSCAIKMFGTKHSPILYFQNNQLDEIAKRIVAKRIAVLGVQQKISLKLDTKAKQLPRLT